MFLTKDKNMPKHIVFGKNAEDTAINYIKSKGFVILARNFRYKHWEADIVARESVGRVYFRFFRIVLNQTIL